MKTFSHLICWLYILRAFHHIYSVLWNTVQILFQMSLFIKYQSNVVSCVLKNLFTCNVVRSSFYGGRMLLSFFLLICYWNPDFKFFSLVFTVAATARKSEPNKESNNFLGREQTIACYFNYPTKQSSRYFYLFPLVTTVFCSFENTYIWLSSIFCSISTSL